MSNIHTWIRNRRTRSKCRSVVCALTRAAIEALMLAIATFASAHDKPAATATVEVRVQMSWLSKASRGHPLTATVALEPLDHKGARQDLRISESSVSIVRLAPGRYQLSTTSPMVVNGQAYGWSIEVPLVAPVNYIQLSQENAVRLSLDNDIAPVANASPPPATSAPSHVAADVNARAQITALLDRWTTSLKARNLQAQMSCYAPRLTSYLKQRNVSREQVKIQKQKLLQLYTRVRRLDLSDIELRIDDGQATVSAVRNWNFSNNEVDSQGHTLVNFELAKINSRWVITSERERLK